MTKVMTQPVRNIHHYPTTTSFLQQFFEWLLKLPQNNTEATCHGGTLSPLLKLIDQLRLFFPVQKLYLKSREKKSLQGIVPKQAECVPESQKRGQSSQQLLSFSRRHFLSYISPLTQVHRSQLQVPYPERPSWGQQGLLSPLCLPHRCT